MAEVNALGYRLVQRNVRPPRALTLLCSGGDWRADVLRMVECYARTWGGDGHGLIACSPEWEVAEPFWRLAEAFDADHWAVFARTGRGLQMSDPQAYEAQLASIVEGWARENDVDEAQARRMLEPQLLSSGGAGRVAPQELGDRIRRRMAPLASAQVAVTAEFRADEAPPHRLVDMCGLTFQPERITGLDVDGLPPAVQLLVAARAGLVAPGHLARLRERGEVDHATVPVDREDLVQVLRYAWTGRPETGVGFTEQEFLDDMPLAQSRLGCSWFTTFDADADSEPLVVICGDGAEDFCYAYTRQRVVGDAHWLPVGPDTADLSLELYTELMRLLYDLAVPPVSARPVLLSSLTLDEDQLHEVRDRLLATPWGRMAASGSPGRLDVRVCAPSDLPVRRRLHLLDKAHVGDTLHEPFLGTDQARKVEIPLPSEAVGVQPDSCRWQVDVLDPKAVLPARWALNDVITADGTSWGVRSSTSGISIDSHGRIFTVTGTSLAQLLVQVRLRVPTARQVFSTLLAGAGVTLEESDKGRYTRRMIELWGDFAALAADLKEGPAANLLSGWISAGKEPGRVYQDRKYLTLADVRMMTGGSEESARQLLDGYLQRSIATRGLLLTCGQCVGTGFYRLEDIGSHFRCQRCRQHNPIVRSAWKGQELEPQWYYGLDEVAYQGLRSNIHVPILALAALAEPAHSFQHMPEAVVRRDGYPDLEVDLWAIVDGRIVIGEAKISDRLEPTKREEARRCAALKGLIDDLSADEFVMATTGPAWDRRTETLVNEKIAQAAKVTWLTNLR
ncbi:hypothetical protein ABT186_18105 [Streptomyces sp. NPDC001634]|uniref:hypothetical protein n=1 Tax=Streptomyces sp. NPDC001634 TaxID=3154390 RepID=UPI0033320CFD